MKPLAHRRHGRDLVTITVAAVGILLGSACGAGIARAEGAGSRVYDSRTEPQIVGINPARPITANSPLPGRWTWTPDGAFITNDRLGVILKTAATWKAQAEELPAALDALEASRREAEALRAEVAALRSSLDLVTRDRDSLGAALVTERASVLRVTRSRRRWRTAAFGGLAFIAGGYAAARVLP